MLPRGDTGGAHGVHPLSGNEGTPLLPELKDMSDTASLKNCSVRENS